MPFFKSLTLSVQMVIGSNYYSKNTVRFVLSSKSFQPFQPFQPEMIADISIIIDTRNNNEMAINIPTIPSFISLIILGKLLAIVISHFIMLMYVGIGVAL